MTSYKDLPEQWTIAAVKDIGQVASGQTPKGIDQHSSFDGDIPWFRVSDMNEPGNEEKLTVAPVNLTKEHIEKLKLHIRPQGTILFPKRGGAIATNKKRILGQNGAYDLNIMGVIPLGIEDRYLWHWFQTVDLKSLSDGSNVPQINHGDIEPLEIPIPPLNEQRRIVAKIEELRTHTLRSQQALDEIPALIDQFRQSVLAAAFRGDLTADWRKKNPDVEPAEKLIRAAKKTKEEILGKYKEPKPIEVEELPDIPETWGWTLPQTLSSHESNSICAGPFGTIFKAKDFRDSGIPIIFLRHVGPGKYLTHKPGFMDTNKWEEIFQPYSVWGGELLITKLGEPPGTCAIYPEGIGPAMVTPDVIKMSVNQNAAKSEYLMHYFNSEISRKIAFGVAYGVTRLRMNLPLFRSLPVPLAPLAEQAEICTRITRIFRGIEAIEHQYQGNSDSLNQLNQSILAKAFRGELVPQDPNDEPASVLLDRIRAERETLGTTKTQKRSSRKRTQ